MTDRVLTVHGARGSMCVSGAAYRRYGGNTTCLHVEVSPGVHLLVDVGTGLRAVEHALGDVSGQEFHVFLTHYHWDHIQGLPVFSPLFDERNRFTFYGMNRGDQDVGEVLDSVIRPPWFPVTLRDAQAGMVFRDLDRPVSVGDITVSTTELRHPQGCAGYRLDSSERSLVVATDHEGGDDAVDDRLAVFARGADVLLHDGQYTVEELAGPRRGWGHSTWEQATEMAMATGASRLVLTSHDPDRSDDEVDDLVRLARARFQMTSAAHEGLTIKV